MQKVVNSPFFTLKLKDSEDKGKFIFSVSKKIDKRATQRNRIKRLLRASLKNILGKETEQNLFFVAKPEILGKTQEEIETEIKKVLGK